MDIDADAPGHPGDPDDGRERVGDVLPRVSPAAQKAFHHQYDEIGARGKLCHLTLTTHFATCVYYGSVQ
jgi:hypothetical protein